MNVLTMVREAVKSCGADGLCNVDLECGCTLDDLAPCGAIGEECEAARNNPERAKDERVDHWMEPMRGE
jgi:hypothetical protein